MGILKIDLKHRIPQIRQTGRGETSPDHTILPELQEQIVSFQPMNRIGNHPCTTYRILYPQKPLVKISQIHKTDGRRSQLIILPHAGRKIAPIPSARYPAIGQTLQGKPASVGNNLPFGNRQGRIRSHHLRIQLFQHKTRFFRQRQTAYLQPDLIGKIQFRNIRIHTAARHIRPVYAVFQRLVFLLLVYETGIPDSDAFQADSPIQRLPPLHPGNCFSFLQSLQEYIQIHLGLFFSPDKPQIKIGLLQRHILHRKTPGGQPERINFHVHSLTIQQRVIPIVLQQHIIQHQRFYRSEIHPPNLNLHPRDILNPAGKITHQTRLYHRRM